MLNVVLEIIELNVHVFRHIKAIRMWFVARTSVWQIQIALPPKHVEMKNVLIHAIVRKTPIVRLVTIEVYVNASQIIPEIHMASDAHRVRLPLTQDAKEMENAQAKKHVLIENVKTLAEQYNHVLKTHVVLFIAPYL